MWISPPTFNLHEPILIGTLRGKMPCSEERRAQNRINAREYREQSRPDKATSKSDESL